MTHTHARTARTSTLKHSSPHFVQADYAMSCSTKRNHPPSDWMSEEIEDLEIVPPRRRRWLAEELQSDPIRNRNQLQMCR